jgi:3-deoxy-D-manno-octulosonic-acid transferase
MSARLPATLALYRAGLTAFEPAVGALLRRRVRAGKEDPARLGERRGVPGRDRPPGDLVWVHGASVGETLTVLPLVERLTRGGLGVLVTSGTYTSAELLAHRLPAGAIHQYLPLDVPRYVRRFLRHWQPHVALFAESELWPNMVLELERHHAPLVLVNARLSPRSFARWQKMPGMAQALLRKVSLCLAQSAADAERLDLLGAFHVIDAGNLKFDVPPPPADPRLVEALAGETAGRPLWVAASTHPGEEEIVLAAHQRLASRHPRLLTIIAPRHPHRGAAVAALAASAGLAPGLRSQGSGPDRRTNIYVADTIGELGLFYRLASVVFMGGSLVPHGGQNPIEAAKLGAALLHGPHVHNFHEVYGALDHTGGAFEVADQDALGSVMGGLLRDTALTRDMARAAQETVEGLGGALARTLDAIEPYLPSYARATLP